MTPERLEEIRGRCKRAGQLWESGVLAKKQPNEDAEAAAKLVAVYFHDVSELLAEIERGAGAQPRAMRG